MNARLCEYIERGANDTKRVSWSMSSILALLQFGIDQPNVNALSIVPSIRANVSY